MKVMNIYPRLLIIFSILLCFAGMAMAVGDDFESGVTLSGLWEHSATMDILNGNLHVSSTDGWGNNIALFDAATVNKAEIEWAAEGDGMATDPYNGPEFGGIAITNNLDISSDGYLVYLYSGKIKLNEISNGSVVSTAIDEQSGMPAPTPGSKLAVIWSRTANSFEVYLDDVLLGSLRDSQKRVDLSASSYGGVMLYGSAAVENDIEAFSVESVALDETPPSAVNDLAATTVDNDQIDLTWSATGDDGNSGTAAAFDLRYSASVITEANFNSAYTASEPIPGAPGSLATASVSGLNGGTRYYFAVKVIDESGNASAISNVASAQTDADPVDPNNTPTNLATLVDDFNRADLGGEWETTGGQAISNNELAITGVSSGWKYALLQTKGVYGTGFRFSATNSALNPTYGYITAGLLVLMDSPSPFNANGYALIRHGSKLAVYTVTNGLKGSEAIAGGLDTALPQPGDVVSVDIQDNGSSKSLTYYINGNAEASFTVNSALSIGDSYAGVIQYSAADEENAVDDFIYKIPAENNAYAVNIYQGDGQSGQIGTTLPDPISVQVTTVEGEPVKDVLLDFDLVNGDASLVAQDNFLYDGMIWKQVEDGVLDPVQARIGVTGNPSGGSYVYYDAIGSESRRKSAVTVPIYVPDEDQAFNVWVRFRTFDNSIYKFICVVDDGADSTVYGNGSNEHVYPAAGWVWKRVFANVPMDKGMHDIHLRAYQGDTYPQTIGWDKICVQRTDNTATPSDKGGTGPDYWNMTDSLGIAGTQIRFENNANDDVVIHVSGSKADGSLLENAPLIFTLNPTAGPAQTMERDPNWVEPTNTSAGVDSPPLQVIFKDAFNNLVGDVATTWTVESGDGTLQEPVTFSNESGVAENIYRLGFQTSNHVVRAAVDGLSGSPVEFTLHPDKVPYSMVLITPTSQLQGVNGTILDDSLVVRVLQQNNLPFENFPVQFKVTAGDGGISTLNGNEDAMELDILTDANGYATAKWRLGAVGLNEIVASGDPLVGSPITFTAMGLKGQPSVLLKEAGDNQTGYVGMPLAEDLTVKLTDLNGFPIPESEMYFEIIQGNPDAFITNPGNKSKTVYTSAEGTAAISLNMGSALNDVHKVRVTAIGTGIDPVVFTGTTSSERIAQTLEYVSGSGQSASVLEALPSEFVVRALDPYRNPVVNQPVTFRVINGGGVFDGYAEVTVQTDGSGEARALLTLGTLAGDSVHVVHAIANRIDKPLDELENSPIIFKASGLPKPAQSIAKVDSSDMQEGQVGRALNNQIGVKVKDVHGNGVRDHNVTFEIQGEGGFLVAEDSETKKLIVKTDDMGCANVIWKMPNTPGTVYLKASAVNNQGDPLLDSPLTFVASAQVGPADKLVRMGADSVLVGTVYEDLDEPLLVRVVDRLDNPISNYIVFFRITDENNSLINNGLQEIEIPTDEEGKAWVNWQLGRQSGFAINEMTVTAAVENEDSSTVVFQATGMPDTPYRMIPDSTWNHLGVAGNVLTDPIKVQVVDQYGNGVPQQDVEYRIIPDAQTGNAGFIDSVTVQQKIIATDDAGYAIVRWGLGPKVGSLNNVLQAHAKYQNVYLLGSPAEFKATGQTGAASTLVKVTDDTTKELSATIGNTLGEQLKVKVVDDNDNPVARFPVLFQVRSRIRANGGTLDGKVDTVKTVETNANGIAAVTFELGLNSGVKNNQVHVSAVGENGLDLKGSPTSFLISGLATDATQMARVDGDGQTGRVGQPLEREISVKIMDEFNNESAGQSVNFRILPREGLTEDMLGSFGESMRADTSVYSNAEGIAKVVWKLGDKVGDYYVEAISYSGSDTLTGGPIQFKATATADVTNADSSFITIETDTVQVSAGDKRSSVIVNLRDKYNNPVANKAVSFKGIGENITVAADNPVSDMNGRVYGYVFSDKVGEKLITANDINSTVAISDTVSVYFTPADPAAIRKAVAENGDNQSQNIGTVLENALKVEITDAFGNIIHDYPVTFQANNSGAQIISNMPVKTDSNGIAAAKFRLGNTMGPYTVTAKSTGISGSVIFNATAFNPSTLHELRKISGDGLEASPGQQLSEPIGVRVYDEHNNFVYNASVGIEVVDVNNGQILDQVTKPSNEYGEVTFEVQAGTNLGANIFHVFTTDPENRVSTNFYCETVPPGSEDAKAMSIYAGNFQAGTVGQTLPLPLQVFVTDEFGNGAAGYDVTFTVGKGNTVDGIGSFNGGQESVIRTTDADGIASVYYTMGIHAGVNKVTVRASNLDPKELTFSLTGEAAEPYSMELVEDTNNQTGEMGKDLLMPLAVLIKDVYQNPAPGGAVLFASTDGYSSISSAAQVMSGPDGLAKASWQLGPKPNSNVNTAVATAKLAGKSYVVNFTAIGDNSNWPDIQAPDAFEMWEGQSGSFEVTATDEDGDLFLITVDPETLPDGATFTKSTNNRYIFQWTPGNEIVQPPATFVDVVVDFEVHEVNKPGRDRKSVPIKVNDQNQAPQVNSYSPSSLLVPRNEGQSIIHFSVSASDPDPSDELSYAWFVNGEPVSYHYVYDMPLAQYSSTTQHRVNCIIRDLAGENISITWTVQSSAIVELSSFSSRFEPYKGVLLEWETSTEMGNTGFNVLRSTSEHGNYKKINEELLPALDDGFYEFTDNATRAGMRYWYKIEDVSVSGIKTQHGPVQAESTVPTEFALKQNYPNPFNPTTTVRYELPELSLVKIEIYNIMGQKVRTLVDRQIDAGYHEVIWDGKNAVGNTVSSGIYLYRINAGDFNKAFKMSLIR